MIPEQQPMAGGRPIDVAGHSDLLVITNDLVSVIGADVSVLARASRMMRGHGPSMFGNVTKRVGVTEIADHVLAG